MKNPHLAIIAFLGITLLLSCKEKTDQATPEPEKEATANPVDLKLAEWRKLFESLKDDKDAYGKAAYRFGKDESIPPRESLKFGKEFFEGGSWVGHFVMQFSRAKKNSNSEAMALALEWQDDKSILATNTSIAIEAGKNNGLEGLEWAKEFRDKRVQRSAIQYVSKGFQDTIESNTFSAIEAFLRELATIDGDTIGILKSSRYRYFKELEKRKDLDQEVVTKLRDWFDRQLANRGE